MSRVRGGETKERLSDPAAQSSADPRTRPPHPGQEGRAWRPAVGWLTGVAVLAAVAINVAGIGAIAVAQRGVVEEARRLLRLEAEARAGALESVLASTRADLAFLTGSPIFFGLESALVSRDPREARWRRLEAEGALLLFLRGHPETAHLAARSDQGAVLVSAGRRGGIPVLWKPGDTDRAAQSEAAGDPEPGQEPVAGRAITGRFEFATGVRRVSGAVMLEATIDGGRLLAHNRAIENPARACALLDRTGSLLATEPDAADAVARAGSGQTMSEAGAGPLYAEAPVHTESWSTPSPWRLVCTQRRGPAEALVAPLSARYRMTLLLNLAVMSLALLLGMFAVKEGRRRQALEAAAREEARVRDLERQLFHSERLSTVGRLAAGMAHEINNPLEGMSNYLSLAREDLKRDDASSAARRLEMVQEGLRRAGDIVRQVLEHADPATAPRVVLDLNGVLRQTVDFVKSRPEFRSIRFEQDLPALPLGVKGSQALLGQVFMNLLLNACEAQPAGGEVRVSTRSEGERVVAEIADRGPGVPPGDGARIFEPFYSTKHSTGLGLSVCYSIVTQHGGDLAVADREGGGAIFRMSFPAARGHSWETGGGHA
jgi:signal transduction histidine kinase